MNERIPMQTSPEALGFQVELKKSERECVVTYPSGSVPISDKDGQMHDVLYRTGSFSFTLTETGAIVATTESTIPEKNTPLRHAYNMCLVRARTELAKLKETQWPQSSVGPVQAVASTERPPTRRPGNQGPVDINAVVRGSKTMAEINDLRTPPSSR
jgi:hypothetical protein